MSNPVLGLPLQPQNGNDSNYAEAWNRWVGEHMAPAMRTYFDRFRARLEALGQTVQVTYSQGATDYFNVVPSWSGTLTKSGITAEWSVTLNQAESRTPEELADHYDSWIWGQVARASSNAGGVKVWQDPYPTITPGPATTTPTGGNTSQPAQTNPAPNSGTTTSYTDPAPTADPVYTFDGWNYVYKSETGRDGPQFEEVITDPSKRSNTMTRAQYMAIITPWLNGTTNVGSGGTSGAASGGTSGGTSGGSAGGSSDGAVMPTTDMKPIVIGGVAVILAILALRR